MSAPRYLPARPLPEAAFVPGRGQPHPRLAGPTEGTTPPPPLDADRPRDCRAFLISVDLFNHGYYWEAHEGWEALWHASGRTGPVADLLRGLIKLAAAGVKVRQAMPEGVKSHGERAAQHFADVKEQLGAVAAGLDLDELARFARGLAEAPDAFAAEDEDSGTGPRVVFAPLRLLDDEQAAAAGG